ncbi:MAG: DUF3352 domain-containing protein, partial [Chloroflexota bacterium]|nr:DUF3352 domain-containing protein [Chloroflexota bacterium]
MTVTPNSDAAPWDTGPRDPSTPPSGLPQLEPARPRRRFPLRWVAALLATVLVGVALVAVLMLARPPAEGGVSPLAEYAPADTAAYVEARLDLPGDQRDGVISFMSHFPGFADPATFEQKVGDTIDTVLRSSPTDIEWKRDIEPWFGGQLALMSSSMAPSVGTPQSATFALSVKDRARLDEFISGKRLTEGLESEEYRGTTIYTGRVGDQRLALAVT